MIRHYFSQQVGPMMTRKKHGPRDWADLFESCPHIEERVMKSLDLESALTCRIVCEGWRDQISEDKKLQRRLQRTPIFKAVRIGPLTTNVVAKFEGVDNVSTIKWTPLGYAAHCGKTDVVQMLISQGADVNKSDELYLIGWDKSGPGFFNPTPRGDHKGLTPLSHAVMKGHKDTVELLIKRGADVNLQEPLVIAAEKGQIEIAKLLLTSGANIEQYVLSNTFTFLRRDNVCLQRTGDGCHGQAVLTALHFATKKGDLEMVKLLVTNKAALSTRNFNQLCYPTPLHMALKSSFKDIAQYLIRAGSDPNAVFMVEHCQKYTPLSMAMGYLPKKHKDPDFETGMATNSIFCQLLKKILICLEDKLMNSHKGGFSFVPFSNCIVSYT